MESKEGDDYNVYDGSHFNRSEFSKRLNKHLGNSEFERKLEVNHIHLDHFQPLYPHPDGTLWCDIKLPAPLDISASKRQACDMRCSHHKCWSGCCECRAGGGIFSRKP
jgi:hypothetical protein